MSNKQFMKKCSRERYLAKVNAVCKIFRNDLRFELAENCDIVWHDTTLSHVIPYTKNVSVIPRMVYDDYIRVARLAEANFRMIAVDAELQEMMIHGHKWLKAKDGSPICVMKLKKYKLELGCIGFDENNMLVVLAGQLDKERPKDEIQVMYFLPGNKTDEETITNSWFLKTTCTGAADFYAKQVATFVTKYVNFFSDHVVAVDAKDERAESQQLLHDVVDNKLDAKLIVGHRYYVLEKNGGEGLFTESDETILDDLKAGDRVFDLTAMFGEGNEPTSLAACREACIKEPDPAVVKEITNLVIDGLQEAGFPKPVFEDPVPYLPLIEPGNGKDENKLPEKIVTTTTINLDHTYYVKYKDEEEILAKGRDIPMDKKLAECQYIVDLTMLCQAGHVPATVEEFHEMYTQTDYMAYTAMPPVKVVQTTEGTNEDILPTDHRPDQG